MIDKLIDLVISILDHLRFWEVVKYYNRGVKLCFGKPIRKNGRRYPEDDKTNPIREIQPGIYWRTPLADQYITIMVKMDAMPLDPQTIITSDGIEIVVQAVLKYEIDDARIVILEVHDPVSAMADRAQGIIRSEMINATLATCNTSEFLKVCILPKVKTEAAKWGIRVVDLTLQSLGRFRSIRLLSDKVK
jgi:regulator of protease activity HflC (stomatin/prohibitin superfamily)